MMRALMTAALLCAAAALFRPIAARADEPVPLKPGPGLEAVQAACSTCHTLNYIRMNSPFLTPEAWKAEVTKMQKAFGGPFDDDAAAAIVNYLNANYGAPAKP